MKFGYARISTPQQSMEYQISTLMNSGCEKILKDITSGAHSKRPGFDEMSNQLRAGDVVTVTTLDRLGRSTLFLLNLIDEWNKKNIHLHILSHQIDTTTTQGKFMFDIMAALAEQERNLIKERIQSGIAAARLRGHYPGRPKKLRDTKIKRMIEIYHQKSLSVQEICLMYGICRKTLYNYLERENK